MDHVTRMADRMDAEKASNREWQHAYAVGMNDARNETTRHTWGWCNRDRAAYHIGWMEQAVGK